MLAKAPECWLVEAKEQAQVQALAHQCLLLAQQSVLELVGPKLSET